MLALQQVNDSITFKNKGLSENSKTLYTLAVQQYRRYLQETGKTQGFDSIKSFLDTFNSGRTRNSKLQALKSFYIELFKSESAEKRLELLENFNSIKRVKTQSSVKKTDYLTEQEVKDLKKTIRHYDKWTPAKRQRVCLFVQSFFETGCRVSELLNIKLKDCKQVNVKGSQYIQIKVTGKGSKERTVWLSVKTYNKVLNAFKTRKGRVQTYLFTTMKATQFDRINVTNYVKQAGKKAGFNISCHSLRHSHAMHLKDADNWTAEAIADSLGHANILVTIQYYFHSKASPDKTSLFA